MTELIRGQNTNEDILQSNEENAPHIETLLMELQDILKNSEKELTLGNIQEVEKFLANPPIDPEPNQLNDSSDPGTPIFSSINSFPSINDFLNQCEPKDSDGNEFFLDELEEELGISNQTSSPIISEEWKHEKSQQTLEKIESLRALYLKELQNLVQLYKKELKENLFVIQKVSSYEGISQDELNANLKQQALKEFSNSKKNLQDQFFSILHQISDEYKQSTSKKRKRFSPEIIDKLEKSFSQNPYPNEEQKKMLAEDCSLSLKQVINWMTNKRSRTKME